MLTEGSTAKVGDTDQESGVTPNDFSSALTYTLSSEDGMTSQDWVVTVTKDAPSTGKDIVSFRFEDLDPAVNGIISSSDHSVSLEVPSGTNVSALVPTIGVSENATVSPEEWRGTGFLLGSQLYSNCSGWCYTGMDSDCFCGKCW